MGAVSELGANRRLVFAAMLGTGMGFPTVPFYTVGIFAPILAQEFGWSFASILGGLTLIPMLLLIGGPLVGYLIDRHGPRKVAAISLVTLGLAYTTLAFSTGSIVQYYATWVLLTIAGIGCTPISFTRAINSAFVKQRGIALGITLAGMGLFTMAVKPLGAWLIAAVGWRGAIVLIGLLPIVVGAPVVWWGLKARQIGAAVEGASEAPATGLTLKQALHTRTYWTLIFCFVPLAFAIGAQMPNMENILRSMRMDATDIVMLTSLIGISMIAGRLVGGWLIDRTWAPLTGAIFVFGAAFSCWMLSHSTLDTSTAMLAILLLGFAAGLEVDLMSYLVARYLGMLHYGALYGLLFGLFSIGAAIGPSLLGHAFDVAGSYSSMLRVCALVLAVVAVIMLSLGRYPERS
jgi:MFS family permease